jgi:hypothetical protein
LLAPIKDDTSFERSPSPGRSELGDKEKIILVAAQVHGDVR